MATSAQDLGGYDCLFVSEPPGVYTCLICTFVAKDCQQMDCCGRVYCGQCLAENKKRSEKCPSCRQHGNSVKDKRADREIKALKVKCANLDSGCQWVGELRSLEEHVHSCDYGLILCINNCKQDDGKMVKVLKNDLGNHLANECPRRPYHCPHCEEIGEYEEMTTLHTDSCPKVRVQCPNSPCHYSMLRCYIDVHRSLCDYEEILCKFSNTGCQERPFRKNLKDHEEDILTHFTMTTDNLLLLKKRIRELEARNNKLEKTFMVASSSRPFTFRMTNYERYEDQQKYFCSPSFCSAGYMFSVYIKAGGYGVGKGTHLSVVICLMKGENDDFLTWPFTGSVTIELLNQLKNKNHHQVTTKFPSDSSCSQRVTDHDIEQGWGVPQFISNRQLLYSNSRARQYLHQGSLIFRVTVRIPGHKPWLQCTT